MCVCYVPWGNESVNKYIETDIKEVKEQLVWNRQHGHKTILLLGSGISVTAGIPAAEGIIERIRTDFSSVCARTHPVTYEDHLAVLTPTQRQTLIKELVSAAKLNAAHLHLAAIVREGFADKIITTNFDTLIHRALALENIYPNIFDFTGSSSAESADFSNISLFHMHGQKDGALSLRDEEDHDRYLHKMEKFFRGNFEKQTVIVVGFSGTEDPIFSYLASLKCFENRLYWVGHLEAEPEEHVYREILRYPRKQACYIKGYDADGFFSELNRLLEIPGPRILANPMGLVEEVMGNISVQPGFVAPPIVPEEEPSLEDIGEMLATPEVKAPVPDIREERRQILSESVNKQIDEDELVRFAKDTWVNNVQVNYEKLRELVSRSDSEDAKKYFSFFLFNWGAELEKLADNKHGVEADNLYKEAFGKFEEAISIKPDLREAYNQWGVCLRNLAKSKQGEEAEQLYADAFSKFEEAILINPDHYEPYNNWAIGLANLAETKNEVEAEKLYNQAFDKYQEAIKNKPDLYDVYNNWGVCLKNLAALKRNGEADAYFNEAFQKFEQAVRLNPDYDMAYTNWGMSLREMARMKKPEEATALYEQAFAKYAAAIEHNPNTAAAYNQWGVDLGHLSRLKGVEEARFLLQDAFDKYGHAVAADPKNYVAMNNWAIDLWNYANLLPGAEAEKYYNESFEKFDQALALKPKSAEILTNKAICLSKVSELENQVKSESIFNEALTCFFKATQVKPKLYEAYYQWGIAFRNHAEMPGAVRVEELYIQSLKQFEKAMKSKPEKYRLNTQWDAAMSNLAEYLFEDEPEKMYQQIFKRYQDAIYTERTSLELYNTYDLNLTKVGDTTPEEDYQKLLNDAMIEPAK